MEELIKVLPKMKKFTEYINDVKKANFPISLSGLSDSQKAHFIYATRFYTEKPVLVVTYNEIELKKMQQDMKFFGEEEAITYPKKEVIYYDIDTMNKDVTMDRLDVYSKLYNQDEKIILTTVEAIMQKTIPKTQMFKRVMYLENAKKISMDLVKESLVDLGYERCDMVEGRGQFSVRGGIIDVFPLNIQNPVRIEFWGDEIDSIRTFDVESQRSIDTIKQISILPVEEFLVDKEELSKIADNILKEFPENIEDVEQIRSGNYLSKVDKYFKLFYSKDANLFDYLNKDTIIFLDEPSRIKSKCQAIEFENKEMIEQYLEKYKMIPSYTKAMSSFGEIVMALEENNIINMERIDPNTHAKRNGYSFNCREVNFFRGSMDIFTKEVQKSHEEGKSIIILAGTMSKAKSIATMLIEHQISTIYEEVISEINSKQVIVTLGSLSEGFEYIDLGLIIVAGQQDIVKEKKRSYKPKAFNEGKKVVFADLRCGGLYSPYVTWNWTIHWYTYTYR